MKMSVMSLDSSQAKFWIEPAEGLANRDSRALLENIAIVIDQGLNLQQFVREFIGRVRDLLMIKLGLEDKVIGGR